MSLQLRRAPLAALVVFVALSTPAPAGAARVVKVRVGTHAEFTRVVFELDASAGYRVERIGGDANPALRVTVEAVSGSHKLRSSGDIATVQVEAGSNALAHVALRKPGLRVQEMILSNPPRIVLDVMRAEPSAELAATPRAKKPATAATAPQARAAHPAITPPLQPERRPAPPPIEESKAKPAEARPTEGKPAVKPPDAKTADVKPGGAKPAEKPAEKKADAKPAVPPQIAHVEPSPTPAPATAKPSPTPEPAASKPAPAVPPSTPAITPAAARVPEAAAASKVTPAPSPATPAITPITPPSAPEPAPKVVPEAVDRNLAPAPLPGPQPIPALPEGVAKPAPTRPTPPAAAKRAPVTPVPPAPKAVSDWRDRASGIPLWISAAAAAVVLVVIGAVLYRRNRPLPNDLDVTAIAEESDDAGVRLPGAGFQTGAAARVPGEAAAAQDNPFDDLFDAPPPAAPAPLRQPPASALADFPVPAPALKPKPPATSSLFDDDDDAVEDASRGDAPMTQEMDLPIDRSGSVSPPPPAMSRQTAPGPDVTRMLQDLERRISALESRLDESNEAREKLERQVAAQSEELRVQRAAIARTQRALRTMSRGDEDKATEPALRDGETQTKTRANV